MPVIGGYQCRVSVSDGLVAGIVFTPLPGSRLWTRYRNSRDAVSELRAIAGAAAAHNLLELSRDAAESLADRVRELKLFDPTLGVIAGTAYAAVGLRDRVASVLEYSRRDLGFDLFDLWLFAGARRSDLPLFPACPLTTAGWSYLDIVGAEVPMPLRRAGRLGGFWTTFAAGEMEQVAGLLQEGNIE
ncbi:MAG: hypothetical protein EOO66_13415 [Methylobacterium sp.]|nr:MAG: hypothetical protein EOO66_13415 [Methylobacterium sp.]